MTDLVLPIRDASAATGIPASTIHRWVANGELMKHGRWPVKVSCDEVEKVRRRMHANKKAARLRRGATRLRESL